MERINHPLMASRDCELFYEPPITENNTFNKPTSANWIVFYAMGTKAKEFSTKKDAVAFMKTL